MSALNFRGFPVVAAFAGAFMAGTMLPAAARGPESVADVAQPLLSAVVNIATSQTVTGSRGAVPAPKLPEGSPFQHFFDEFLGDNNKDRGGGGSSPDARPRRVQSLGSGFVIDASGIIVTNNHVIEGADEITVNFTDGSKLTAKLIGHDDKTDLAVLQVTPPKPLTQVKFGDSNKIRVGDWVMAIGNPFGLGGTVTLGIVSARNRDINSGPYDNFIQTDASINRGNSGGPLFNMDGDVIGINTAIISPSGGSIGIGFAVPSEIAVTVIDQLRQFGEMHRGWLGVRIQQVTDEVASGLAMGGPARGALVASVDGKGPAAAAGISAGDVILEFAGQSIDAMHELPRIVAGQPVGKKVKVRVLRKGKEELIDVTLGRLEEAEKTTTAAKDAPGKPKEEPKPTPMISTGPLGLSLSDMSPDLRTKYAIKDSVSGVVVTGVADNSPAADKRVQPGDVIIEIAQQAVKSADEVVKRLAELKTAGRKNALLAIVTKNGDQHWVALPIE
ncbi:Do family serine endopeptidase [soil metagenome]